MELKQNMNEIFSDGIANITLLHGLVYLDLFHIIPSPGKQSERVPFLRITLPLHGFVELFSTGETIMKHMQEIGVIRGVPVNSEASAQKGKASAAEKKPGRKPAAKPAPAKKAEAPAKPAAKPVPAKKAEAPAKPAAKPVPAKKAEAPAKPAAKPAPAKKAAPAPKAPAKGKKAK